MDSLIKRFDFVENKDLRITKRGIAYQKEMSSIVYDESYFKKCAGYDKEISDKVTKGRIDLVAKYHKGKMLDIGVGAGEFVKSRHDTEGFDVNPYAVQWLKENSLYSENFESYEAFSFWDTIEHVKEPNVYFKGIPKGSYVFVSIPIVNLNFIRDSKHYRPNEHLYYFTEEGFVGWMRLYGFRLEETSRHEIEAGRQDILSFVFKRDLPDYGDYVGLYREIHSTKHYGSSAWLYLKQVTEIVKWLNPASILDYGCGRSDLASHFYLDGERVIKKYDPAIPEYKDMPEGGFDLVICCDVMEHIPLRDVQRVFNEIITKSRRVVFVISLKLARAKLPDGQNAHVTILTKSEWMRWIKEVFGETKEIKTQWNHVLMLKTF